jgi:hypothetical protein
MPHYSTRNSSKNQHNAPQTSPACPLPYDADGFVLDEFVNKKFERDKDESRTENEIQALKSTEVTGIHFIKRNNKMETSFLKEIVCGCEEGSVGLDGEVAVEEGGVA